MATGQATIFLPLGEKTVEGNHWYGRGFYDVCACGSVKVYHKERCAWRVLLRLCKILRHNDTTVAYGLVSINPDRNRIPSDNWHTVKLAANIRWRA